MAGAQTLNTGLWFYGNKNQVNTGADCVYMYKECESTTMGYWYDFDDRKNDYGDSWAEYPYEPDKYGSTINPEIKNLGYVTIRYHLMEPVNQTTNYPYNFVGLGFNVKNGDQESFNISGTNGLCATYTSDYPVTLVVRSHNLEFSDACSVTLPASTIPTMENLSMSSFKQPSWVKNDPAILLSSCNVAFANAQAINFVVEGGGKDRVGQLRIFEVGPYGTCTGESTIANEPSVFECKSDGAGSCQGTGTSILSSSSSADIIRSSSSKFVNNNPLLNTGIWFNGSNKQVNTGADCVYKYKECESSTMGLWYDYDDRKNDHGDSYAEYPYEPDKYGSPIAPEIENLGYVMIKYNLKEPVNQTAEYPYNFVGLGFNLKDEEQTPFDISGTGGLCVTYTADHPVTLQIKEEFSGDALCEVTLKATAIPRMIDTSITDFKQPSWAFTRLSSCMEAFKNAQAIIFKMDGEASAISGILRIFEVGPIGTCTGAGAIAVEPATFACKSDGLSRPDYNECTSVSSSSAFVFPISSSSGGNIISYTQPTIRSFTSKMDSYGLRKETMMLNTYLDYTTFANMEVKASLEPVILVMRENFDAVSGTYNTAFYGYYIASIAEGSVTENGVRYNMEGVLRDALGNEVESGIIAGDQVAFNFPYDFDFVASDTYLIQKSNYASQGVTSNAWNTLIEWTKKITFHVYSDLGGRETSFPALPEDWTDVLFTVEKRSSSSTGPIERSSSSKAKVSSSSAAPKSSSSASSSKKYWNSTNTILSDNSSDGVILKDLEDEEGKRSVTRTIHLEKGEKYRVSVLIKSATNDDLASIKVTNDDGKLCSDVFDIGKKETELSCSFKAKSTEATVTISVASKTGKVVLSNYTLILGNDASAIIAERNAQYNMGVHGRILEISTSDADNLKIQVFDILGNAVLKKSLHASKGTATVSLSTLPRGNYVIRATGRHGTQVIKANLR